MVKMTCFRFNLDNPEHAKAWEYLHSIDKDKVKSGNTAVVRAVNDYFDRMQKLFDDPYFETRQREERFIEQIVTEVGKAFIAEMPKFLASLMLSLNRGYPMQAVPVGTENSRGYAGDGNPSATEGFGNADNSENDDYYGIDFDFIGG